MNAATQIKQVRELSDRVLAVLAVTVEQSPNFAIIALLDARVRGLGLTCGMDSTRACKELARVAESIGRAEAGQ